VPEHLLDDLHIGTSGDGQARRGVPQLVRVKSRNPDGSGSGIEVGAAEDGGPSGEPRRTT
jgi:hypothetical protein